MTNQPNLTPDKKCSLESDAIGEELENLSDSERRAKYGSSGPRKSSQSKREMMEALSRERFPWEE